MLYTIERILVIQADVSVAVDKTETIKEFRDVLLCIAKCEV